MKNLFKVIGILVVILLLCVSYMFYNLYRLAPNGSKAYSTYTFPHSKYYLENEIDSLIQIDKTIYRKTLDDDPTSKFYNSGSYFTIQVDSVEFIFRYMGDSLDWNKSNEATLFLTSANSFKKKKLSKPEILGIAERQFINKLSQTSN